MQKIITVNNGVARNPAWRLAAPVNLCIGAGEHVAIVGPNGSGKTLLVNALTGRYPLLGDAISYDFGPSSSPLASDNIRYIAFRDSYGEADGSYYYQQRWNSQEHMVLLSSGELRKLQLTKALLDNPRLLILDNPFIGLDASTRDRLRALLARLTGQGGLQLILVLSREDEIPDFVTHVIPVKDGICGEKTPREAYLESLPAATPAHVLPQEKADRIEHLSANAGYASDHVIDLNHVSIRYGTRTILNGLDWTVRKGERWALSGENGAGKSTLLSLVCADNPQSYACDIALFGRRRGSGESIWEIKKHIGYVSPEMHRAYLKNLPALSIVASGLHDSVGLYRRMRPEDEAQCLWWMDIFGIAGLKDRSFLQLSSGEQRLVLLARAFVKDPELLILDEPLHGLDPTNRRMVKDIIEAFCHRPDKTLVMVTHYEEELGVCQKAHLLFYAQSPDFHKPRLCYYLKILYL